MEKARFLVADALRLRVADSLNNLQAGRIALLESQYESSYQSFTNLLKIEQDKNKIQSEIILHQESISNTYLQENTHLKKKVNVLTWKNVGLALLAIIEAIIIIIL